MTGIVLVVCMLICLLLALAAVPGGLGSDKKKALDDENTPDLHEVIEDGSPLMIFDKREETKALMTAFDGDAIESVSAAAGNEGASSAADTSSQKEITAVYKALKNVIIGEELKGDAISADGTASDALPSDSDAANADGGCLISFLMDDGTECTFAFGSAEVYELNGKYYAASGTKNLWSAVQDLAEE